jgi:hypothetical protein
LLRTGRIVIACLLGSARLQHGRGFATASSMAKRATEADTLHIDAPLVRAV